jgi:magnesium transporter
MYQFCRNELRAVESELKRAEEEIFIGHEREMVKKISELGRIILNFRQTLTSHRYLIEDYSRSLKVSDDAPLVATIKRWRREFMLTYERAQELQDIYHELRGTNDELLSTKQNEIIKTLTIVSFIILPLSLIASVFGMNTKTPLTGTPIDFWYIIGLMIVSTISVAFYFKYKKWW